MTTSGPITRLVISATAALWRRIAAVCITEADEIVTELRIGCRFGVERDSQSNPVR